MKYILLFLLFPVVAFAHPADWMIYSGFTHLDSMRCSSCVGGTDYSPHDPTSSVYQVDVTTYLGHSSGGYPYGMAIGYLNLGSVDNVKPDGIYMLYHVSGAQHGTRWTGGVGPYVYADTETGAGGYRNTYHAALMIQAGVTHSWGRFKARAVWERLTTFDSFDQDVFLIGGGESF